MLPSHTPKWPLLHARGGGGWPFLACRTVQNLPCTQVAEEAAGAPEVEGMEPGREWVGVACDAVVGLALQGVEGVQESPGSGMHHLLGNPPPTHTSFKGTFDHSGALRRQTGFWGVGF